MRLRTRLTLTYTLIQLLVAVAIDVLPCPGAPTKTIRREVIKVNSGSKRNEDRLSESGRLIA